MSRFKDSLTFFGIIFLRVCAIAVAIIAACAAVSWLLGDKSLSNLETTLFFGGAIAFIAGAYSVLGGFSTAQGFQYQFSRSTNEKTFHERYKHDRELLNGSIRFCIYSGGAGFLVLLLSYFLSV